jgi:hypothetical protein
MFLHAYVWAQICQYFCYMFFIFWALKPNDLAWFDTYNCGWHMLNGFSFVGLNCVLTDAKYWVKHFMLQWAKLCIKFCLFYFSNICWITADVWIISSSFPTYEAVGRSDRSPSFGTLWHDWGWKHKHKLICIYWLYFMVWHICWLQFVMALSNPLHGVRKEGTVGKPLPHVEVWWTISWVFILCIMFVIIALKVYVVDSFIGKVYQRKKPVRDRVPTWLCHLIRIGIT